ncbi:MAG: hypothetical protein N2595_03500 [bacterium]|nr:hypothetical protein [bacterium]
MGLWEGFLGGRHGKSVCWAGWPGWTSGAEEEFSLHGLHEEREGECKRDVAMRGIRIVGDAGSRPSKIFCPTDATFHVVRSFRDGQRPRCVRILRAFVRQARGGSTDIFC